MSYWTDKKVVVTGGAGFVGVQLVRQLLQAGASVTVTVLDDFSRGKNRVKGADYQQADAGDLEACLNVFDGADAVFNLAAVVAGVIWNQSHHLEMFNGNLRLLSTPLLAASQCGVKRFLQTSSVCVYAPEYNNPCLEHNGLRGEPTGANAGYSWAKRMGEKLAVWQTEATDLETVIVRPSNIYGPYDYFDERAHVIPALIRKCTEQDEIVANGTGREVREFIYSSDVAAGMMTALEKGEPGRVYNLGTDGVTAVSIRRLIVMIQGITGTQEKPVGFSQEFDAGDNKRWASAERAHKELDWSHTVDLEDGLRRTIEWWQSQ